MFNILPPLAAVLEVVLVGLVVTVAKPVEDDDKGDDDDDNDDDENVVVDVDADIDVE